MGPIGWPVVHTMHTIIITASKQSYTVKYVVEVTCLYKYIHVHIGTCTWYMYIHVGVYISCLR